jgi:hypothetical protein
VKFSQTNVQFHVSFTNIPVFDNVRLHVGLPNTVIFFDWTLFIHSNGAFIVKFVVPNHVASYVIVYSVQILFQRSGVISFSSSICVFEFISFHVNSIMFNVLLSYHTMLASFISHDIFKHVKTAFHVLFILIYSPVFGFVRKQFASITLISSDSTLFICKFDAVSQVIAIVVCQLFIHLYLNVIS